jgi:hypothetical protein
MPELGMSEISMIIQWKPYLMTVQGNGFSNTKSSVSLIRRYGKKHQLRINHIDTWDMALALWSM